MTPGNNDVTSVSSTCNANNNDESFDTGFENFSLSDEKNIVFNVQTNTRYVLIKIKYCTLQTLNDINIILKQTNTNPRSY